MWLEGITTLIIHDPGRGKTRVQLILQLVKLMKVSGGRQRRGVEWGTPKRQR